jgi:hypothetical protein
MRAVIGTLAWMSIVLPSWALLGIPVLMGEAAQWTADHVMEPILTRIEKWMDSDKPWWVG